MDAVLARYLPDFSAPPPPPAAVAEEPDFSSAWFRAPVAAPAPVAVAAPAPAGPEIEPFLPRAAVARPAEDREALIAAAEARGRKQGRAEALAEAQAQSAQERAAQQARFEEQVAQARRDWSAAQGETLAAGFAAAMPRTWNGTRTVPAFSKVSVPSIVSPSRKGALTSLNMRW